jgi:hypothetical protein
MTQHVFSGKQPDHTTLITYKFFDFSAFHIGSGCACFAIYYYKSYSKQIFCSCNQRFPKLSVYLMTGGIRILTMLQKRKLLIHSYKQFISIVYVN